MARLLIAGGETGDLSELVFVQSGLSIDGTVFNDAGGKGGAYAYKHDGSSSGSYFAASSAFNASRLYFKLYFRFETDTAPGADVFYNILTLLNTANTTNLLQLYVQHKTDGTYAILANNNAAAAQGTATIIVAKDTWYRFDVDITIGSGTGAVLVKQDGSTVLNVSAVDFGADNIGGCFAFNNFQASGRSFWIDDFEVDDAALPGEGYIIARSPTSGAPTYDAWSKSTGSDAYALLNDTPFSAADFVRSLLASAAQTALIATFSSTQTGHGNGVINSGDTINGIKEALVAKTDFTDAAGLALIGTAQQGTSTNGGNITLTFSTAPKAGDIVIVTGGHILRTGTSYGPSTANYNAIGSLQTSGASGTGIAFGAWYKIMGTTPDTNVVCFGSGTNGDGASYTARVFRQADGNTPLDVSAVFAGPTTSTNPNPPAIVPSSANCAIVIAAASLVSDTNIGSSANYGSQATGNSAATRPYSSSSLHRILSGGAGASEDPAAIGSTGNAWASGVWFSVSIAIRPTTEAGSRFSLRDRWGGTTFDAPLTLTTSDAYYEFGVWTDTLTNLNSVELGALHGSTSALQTLEDVWVIASYTPSAGTSLSPGRADLVLSTVAPSRVTDVRRDPTQGNVALSPTAPSVVQDIRRDPGQGNVALSTVAPTVAVTANRNISPAAQQLALSTQAPALALTEHRNIIPARADLALSAVAPGVAVSAGTIVSPDSAQLVLSTASPASVQDVHRSPTALDLTLSTFAPSRVTDERRDPGQGNVALSTSAPSVSQDVRRDPAVRDLTLSTFAPSVVQTTNAAVSPDASQLTLSAAAPQLAAGGNISIQPATAQLALSTLAALVSQDVRRDTATGNLAITVSAPTAVVDTRRDPAAGNLALSTVAPSVAHAFRFDPASRDLTLSTFAPSVAQTTNAAFAPSAAQLSLSSEAPQIAAGGSISIQPATVQLVLSTLAPLVAQDVRLDPASGNLVLSTAAAAVVVDARLDPASRDLTLSTFAPVLAVDVRREPAVRDLALSTFAPTVTIQAGEHRNISPSAADLALSTVAPSRVTDERRDPAQSNFALSTVAPSSVVNVRRDPAARDLSLATVAPSVTWTDHRTIEPAHGNVTLSAVAPSAVVSDHVRITPDQANLTLSSVKPGVSDQLGIFMVPDTVELVVTGWYPKVSVSSHPRRSVPRVRGNAAAAREASGAANPRIATSPARARTA